LEVTPLAYLTPNKSAEMTITILTELIKAGRYTPAAVSIDSIGKETVAIKKMIEELHGDQPA
jgi:hypothetical protein